MDAKKIIYVIFQKEYTNELPITETYGNIIAETTDKTEFETLKNLYSKSYGLEIYTRVYEVRQLYQHGLKYKLIEDEDETKTPL
jgi:hypothetical protein